jgi:hypothetical protein
MIECIVLLLFCNPATCSDFAPVVTPELCVTVLPSATPGLIMQQQTSTRDISINMSPIEAALAAIKSLEPREQFSHRKIAVEYHCSRTSLARRHHGLSASRATQAENQLSLPLNKRMSLYAILNASQGEACLLHGLRYDALPRR